MIFCLFLPFCISYFKFPRRYSLPTKLQLAWTFRKKEISNGSFRFEPWDRWGLAGCVRLQGYEGKGKERRELLDMSHLRSRPPTSPRARPPASSTTELPTRGLVMHRLRYYAHYRVLLIQAYRSDRRKYAYNQVKR